ncbi:MAG: glycoside-pentoside-hexuronide (GPH):cation symporter [Oscillospiraceae bacterium]|jgi:GPH family glycoside/pentoside/hexuronide:cation symporter|nr:glycoside-pentoside-hexuronide (GPH):cation symporter [Oscillospiraceae bacterium]
MDCDRITLRDKIGYAFGDMGGQLGFALVGAFLSMFYTDVLGLSLQQIFVLMLVARIWDAVNDPLWGRIIDRRPAGVRGKFRPYLLWVPIPMAVATVLMFTYFPGLPVGLRLPYAYVTYIAFGMLYTGVNIPYGSLASVITAREDERTSLSVFRSVGAGLGGLPAMILLPTFVFSSGAGGGKQLDSGKLLLAVLVMAVCSVGIYFASYRLTRERVIYGENAAKPQLRKTLQALLRSRPFLSLSLASMLLIAVTMYTQTVNFYLFKDYFRAPQLFSLYSVFTYIPMALLLPVLGPLTRKFGKKELCAAGLLGSALAYAAAFLIHTQQPWVYLVFSFLCGTGLTFFTMEVWALVTDVIDYQERRSGQREEGTVYAFYSFVRKIGQTAAGSGGAWALGLIGYQVANAVEGAAQPQTRAVAQGMYTIATTVPAAACLAMSLLLALAYPLGKAKLRELHGV